MVRYIGNVFLGNVERASKLYFSKELERYGLTGSRFIFFMAISRYPGVTKAGLVNLTLYNKSLVSTEVAHLVKMELVTQVADEHDKRLHHLYLSEEGKTISGAAAAVLTHWNKRLYEKIGGEEEEIEQFLYRVSRAGREILKEEFNMELADIIFAENETDAQDTPLQNQTKTGDNS